MLQITHSANLFRLAFPYDPALVAAVKSLPQRRWDPNSKQWSVPAAGAAALSHFLARVQTPVEFLGDAKEVLAQLTRKTEESVIASRQSSSDAEIPAPAGLAYLPYQKAGVAFSLDRPNVLIADEMGLGKTIQAIGVCNADPSLKSILIICPASLRLNWAREWAKWDVQGRTAEIANGDFPQAAVSIINYDILKKHINQIQARSWDCLIVDEAHYLKNHKTQRTQLVLGKWNRDPAKVIKPISARRRVFLTGTPILNRPVESWTIVNSLAPDVFRSWRHFVTRYCAGFQSSFGWQVNGASHLDELQTQLRSSIMVRRLKSEVLTELPPKRRQLIEFPGTFAAVKKEQAAFAASQAKLEALRAAVELAKAESDEKYQEAVKRLREGARAAFTEVSLVRHETALAKLPQVIEHLTDVLEGGKVICFAHHRDVIAKIVEAFPGCVSITGDTAMNARQAAVDRFQKDPECRLIVGNLQAMGVGLTLTASSHVVFAELDWVPGVVTQAEDRAHRIGQQNSVLVQHLVLQDSLDATMAQRLIEKQEVIDKALDKKHEEVDEPIIPTPKKERAATEGTSKSKIEEVAATLSVIQIEAIHLGLKMLSGVCDGAHELDGAGFNKLDTNIGKSLADAARLTPKQAALGLKLVTKYRRQLPQELEHGLARARIPTLLSPMSPYV